MSRSRIVSGINCPECGSLVRIGSAVGNIDGSGMWTYSAGCTSTSCNYCIEVDVVPRTAGRDVDEAVRGAWTIESLRTL